MKYRSSPNFESLFSKFDGESRFTIICTLAYRPEIYFKNRVSE